MARIQFSTNGSTWYIVPINPVEYDNKDSFEVTSVDTVDGISIDQVPKFDTRERIFTWENLPMTSGYIGMVNQLKSYVGRGPIFLRLNRLNFDDSSSVKIKLRNVETSIRKGAGPTRSPYKMSYDTIRVTYVRVPV